jgi:hypothetical protein
MNIEDCKKKQAEQRAQPQVLEPFTLPKPARVFFSHSSSTQLSKTFISYIKGTRLTLGDVQVKCYDHRDQLAAPVFTFEGTRWILVDEVGREHFNVSPELQERFPLPVFIAKSVE